MTSPLQEDAHVDISVDAQRHRQPATYVLHWIERRKEIDRKVRSCPGRMETALNSRSPW
jgi:hypothetical protein